MFGKILSFLLVRKMSGVTKNLLKICGSLAKLTKTQKDDRLIQVLQIFARLINKMRASNFDVDKEVEDLKVAIQAFMDAK